MQAIETYVIPATNTKPTRIAAVCNGNRAEISWPGLDNNQANHAAAATALCESKGWRPDFVGGATRQGYAFVMLY